MRVPSLRPIAGMLLVLGLAGATAAAQDGATALDRLAAAQPAVGQADSLPVTSSDTQPDLDGASGFVDGWEFRFIPYFWLPAIKGDVTVMGKSQPVDISVGDMWDIVQTDLEVIVPIQMEARNGPWTFWVDISYMKINDRQRGSISQTIAGDGGLVSARINVSTDAKVVFKQLLTEFGADYRLCEIPLGEGESPVLTADLRLGGRYMYVKSTVDLKVRTRVGVTLGPIELPPIISGLGRDMGGSRSWIEPLVGAVLRLKVDEKLTLLGRADIGGFGLGSSLTWQVYGAVEYRICKWLAVNAGYRLLDIDFSEDHGAKKFVYDLQLRGPFTSMIIIF
jgi:hypothetical protein